jgi:hypothetical protein
MVKEIFSLYVSGASNTSKSQVKKYLAYFVILVILLLFLFSNFLEMFDTSPKDTNTTKEDKNTTLPASAPQGAYDLKQYKPKKEDNTIKEDRDTSEDELFNIRCVDILCNYNGIDFPKPLFNKLTKKLSPDFIWFFQNSTLTEYFVMLPKDTFDFLQKPQTKDKKDANNQPPKNMPKAFDALASHK